MIVESTNIAARKIIDYQGKQFETGIFKRPITGPLEISAAGIASDTTCDLVNHGGAHKAVYAFSSTHYPYWRDRLANVALAPGAFGENLTISNLDEEAICIGDQLSIGNAVLEVSQPPVPCFKLGVALGEERAPALFTRYFHTGAYLRVLQAGTISVGDNVAVVVEHPARLDLYSLFRAMFDRTWPQAHDVLLRAAVVAELAPEWQEKVQALLSRS